MSRYTAQEAADMVAEARRTVARRFDVHQAEGESGAEHRDNITNIDREAVLAEALARPIETRNQKDARELAERDAEWALERAREEVRRERQRRVHQDDNIILLEQRIAGLEAELLEVARATSSYADALEHELADRSKEVSEMKLGQAKLETEIARLQLPLAEAGIVDRGATIDLPALPSRRVQ